MAGIQEGMTSPFDRIKHVDEAGEFWLARELGEALGYKQWRRIQDVLANVRANILALDGDPGSLLAEVGKNSYPDSTDGRPSCDVRMTRRACYLFAVNADPRKPEVASAKNYFVVRTREAEVGPKPTVVLQRNPWADRFKESQGGLLKYVRKYYCAGDWTIVLAKLGEFLTLEDTLIEHAFELYASDRPDVSVGLCWMKWIRDLPPIGDAPLYLPNQRIEVRVNVYPSSVRQDFEEWYESNYIFNKMRNYLQGKFKKRYGELAADSVAHHFSLAVTGKTCPKIPARNIRAIQANGGIVRAGQILVGPNQKSLGFSD